MSLPLPTSLSPSKVSSFKGCALAFRLSAIDRLPEPPSLQATKGTLVHRALQILMFECDRGERTRSAAHDALARGATEVLDDAACTALALGEPEREEFVADAATLVDNYFTLEDPNEVRVLGTEVMLSVRVGGLHLRGIIDRLELDGSGELVVTDYKTGRAPAINYEQDKLGGIHFYSLLCEQVLGRRPARLQLLHLREPVAISTAASDQSVRGLRQQTLAIWAAVERACEREDFRPKPGRLCAYCPYHAYCPAVGGDLAALPATAAPLAGAVLPAGGVPASGAVGVPA